MNCLDAETLAAWMDGGLTGAALEDVRGHVAGCQRCQMLLGAMGRTRAAIPAPGHERASRRWLAWGVPLTAAATALAIWIAVPRSSSGPPAAAVPAVSAPGSDALVLDAPSRDTPSRDTKQAPAAPASPRANEAESRLARAAPLRDSSKVENEAFDQPALRAPAAAPAAPPAAEADARERSANAIAESVQIAPPCGAAWNGALPAATELVAGSSPAQGICWLVGRGGMVWRSIDGRTWQRVTFPEMTDLSAVQATDARSATVSSVDGRTFTTGDGGLTWR